LAQNFEGFLILPGKKQSLTQNATLGGSRRIGGDGARNSRMAESSRASTCRRGPGSCGRRHSGSGDRDLELGIARRVFLSQSVLPRLLRTLDSSGFRRLAARYSRWLVQFALIVQDEPRLLCASQKSGAGESVAIGDAARRRFFSARNSNIEVDVGVRGRAGGSRVSARRKRAGSIVWPPRRARVERTDCRLVHENNFNAGGRQNPRSAARRVRR